VKVIIGVYTVAKKRREIERERDEVHVLKARIATVK
jgi:hypothetical protein